MIEKLAERAFPQSAEHLRSDIARIYVRPVLLAARAMTSDPKMIAEITQKASVLHADPWDQRGITEIILTTAFEHMLASEPADRQQESEDV